MNIDQGSLLNLIYGWEPQFNYFWILDFKNFIEQKVPTKYLQSVPTNLSGHLNAFYYQH